MAPWKIDEISHRQNMPSACVPPLACLRRGAGDHPTPRCPLFSPEWAGWGWGYAGPDVGFWLWINGHAGPRTTFNEISHNNVHISFWPMGYCPADQGYCIVIFLDIWTPVPISAFFLSLIVFSFMEKSSFIFPKYISCTRYEVCNYLFVLWTKIDNAFYIFPERLELIGVRWPTDWRVSLKFHNGLK